MDLILDSIILEYEKSSFLLDLIEHKSGKNYVKIRQNIDGQDFSQELKINPAILNDIIVVLQKYQKEINKTTNIPRHSYFDYQKQEKIKERYLKGMSIKTLAAQFECSTQIIEQILTNKGIAIVDNELPKSRKKFIPRKKMKK